MSTWKKIKLSGSRIWGVKCQVESRLALSSGLMLFHEVGPLWGKWPTQFSCDQPECTLMTWLTWQYMIVHDLSIHDSLITLCLALTASFYSLLLPPHPPTIAQTLRGRGESLSLFLSLSNLSLGFLIGTISPLYTFPLMFLVLFL